jgi:hypothetical protein
MRKIIVLVAMLVVASSVATSAATIAQWAYNNQASLTNPSTGAGTQAVVGTAAPLSGTGWSTHYTSGTNKSSDPAAGPSPNQYGAFNINNVNTVGAGLQWNVSTVGYEAISLYLDAALSSTTTRNWTWQYTINGTNWIDSNDVTFEAIGSTTWQNGWTIDLSSISGVNNNSNFGFRFVTRDVAGNTSSTIRFDMITVTGDVATVPEPGSMLALTSGLIGTIGFVVRRKRS